MVMDGCAAVSGGRRSHTGCDPRRVRSLWACSACAAPPKEFSRRYKYLLANGQTGLSVAFDMPTLMGQDSDAPTSRGEIGHCGVAVDSLADMETLFDGIPLGNITTSMTINSPAAILLCM